MSGDLIELPLHTVATLETTIVIILLNYNYEQSENKTGKDSAYL